jgi:hypothetical protein
MPNAEWNCFLSPKNKPATPNLYSKMTEQEQLGKIIGRLWWKQMVTRLIWDVNGQIGCLVAYE